MEEAINLESGPLSSPPHAPLLLRPPPPRCGDINSLTVSTRVHFVIHIIKETKTTDVFLNLEVCIKPFLLLCMFLCCREVGNVQSHHCLWEDLKQTHGNNPGLPFYKSLTSDNMFVSRFYSVSFFFYIFDHILGCRLETTWHKMDPVQRESAALIPTSVSDSYMFCPRCFTNLMCIICKSYFIELCPRSLLLHVAVYENTGKLHTVQFMWECLWII